MDHNVPQIEQVEKVGIDAFIYALYAALIPLNMILNFTGNTINRYVGIVAAAFIGMAVLMKRRKGTKAPKPVASLVVFTIWCTLSIFWSVHQGTSIGQYITFISSVALCLICVIREFNAREMRLIKFFMAIPSAFLVFYLEPNKDISWSRGTLTSSAGYADQNSLAANMLFAFWVTIDLYKSSEKKRAKVLYAICAITIIIGMLFIASRGAMLALIVSILVYIFAIKKEKIKFTTILITAISCVLIYFIIVALEITSIERLSIASILEDAGTGRFEIWKRLFRYMSQDGVLRVFGGYGFGTELFITRMATGQYMGIHNTYLEYFFTTGIIGICLMIWFLFSVFKNAKKKEDSIAIVLWVSLMVVCLPLGFFLNKGAWNVLMLAITGLKSQKNNSNEERLSGE